MLTDIDKAPTDQITFEEFISLTAHKMVRIFLLISQTCSLSCPPHSESDTMRNVFFCAAGPGFQGGDHEGVQAI